MKTLKSWNKLVAAVLFAVMLSTGFMRPASAFLDKTRFVAHLGIAYFAFHHWVWNPYQHGDFASGAQHRTSTMVKGGLALLFAVHEVKVSEKIARMSKDPLLQKVTGGLTSLDTAFASIGTKLKSGKFDPHDIDGLNAQTLSVGSLAANAGAMIKDVPVHVPGL